MLKTREINATDYIIYKEKAIHAFETMEWALENNKWTSCGREAVFTCISMCDALLAKYKKLRNISKDHMDAVAIVSKLLPMPTAKDQANKLRKVIALKNLIDYENKNFSPKQAAEICKNAKRFYQWGMEYL